jgi:prephenate dehydrogenase
MWRDICLANRDALGQMLQSFADELQDLAELLREGDGVGLLALFERAKSARDRYVDGIKSR